MPTPRHAPSAVDVDWRDMISRKPPIAMCTTLWNGLTLSPEIRM